jgi:hypothetical protein
MSPNGAGLDPPTFKPARQGIRIRYPAEARLCSLCPERVREIFDAPFVVIASRLRAIIAEGARDPGFVLSKEAYDAAAEGLWTVRIDENERITVDWSRGGEP